MISIAHGVWVPALARCVRSGARIDAGEDALLPLGAITFIVDEGVELEPEDPDPEPDDPGEDGSGELLTLAVAGSR